MSKHHKNTQSKCHNQPWDSKTEAIFQTAKSSILAMAHITGAITMERAWSLTSVSTWFVVMVLDRMVEDGDLREVKFKSCHPRDNRLFVAATQCKSGKYG